MKVLKCKEQEKKGVVDWGYITNDAKDGTVFRCTSVPFSSERFIVLGSDGRRVVLWFNGEHLAVAGNWGGYKFVQVSADVCFDIVDN